MDTHSLLQLPERSSIANTGTTAVRLAPYTESLAGDDFGGEGREQHQYQTISAQRECANFSLEELRLSDYEQGYGASPKPKDDHPVVSSAQPLRWAHDKEHSNHLSLLIGPAIEIRVGTATPVEGPADNPVSWHLPKSLISHHSPFLEAACKRNFKDRRDNLIELAEDDPAIFALFIEWLYYRSFTFKPLSLPSRTGGQSVSIDAECWVLGDKLMCTEFKNDAMKRLYKQLTANIFSTSISTLDVKFACDNSAEKSKLRQLYVDLVATHFSSQHRVQGTVEEWDEILIKQADLRLLLLQGLRYDVSERNLVKDLEYYLDE